jgi:hypothetical protein
MLIPWQSSQTTMVSAIVASYIKALCRGLEPTMPHPDCYARQTARQDGQYLAVMVDACRGALVNLPSHLDVAPAVSRFVERIIHYQTFNAPTRDDEDA